MDEQQTIDVPYFARITDYIGAWSMEPIHFNALTRSLTSFDLKAHIEAGAEPLKSAMTKEAGVGGKSIAIIPLSGILMKGRSSLGGTSTVQARRDIRQAVSDPNVGGIMLHVDSPGGTVAGTFDLAADVRAANKAKPVFAHVDDLGASAAYWAMAPAERITANAPTALVGSIGTIQVIHDASEAADKAGIKTLVIATGPLKGMGTMGTKVTDEQVAHVQRLVNASQVSFDDAVRTGRNMDEKALANVRHGGVLTADDAKSAGLIDGIQSFGKSMDQLMRAMAEGRSKPRQRAILPMQGLCVLPVLQDQWDGTRKQA